MMHEAADKSEYDRWVGRQIPLPPESGRRRLAWFDDLDAAIGVDCLSLAAKMIAQGASGAQAEDIVKGYGRWVTSRVQGAVDLYLASLSLHACRDEPT